MLSRLPKLDGRSQLHFYTVSPEVVHKAVDTLNVIDIIGNSVYLVYVDLQQVERQTPRFPGGDRLEAGRVSALSADGPSRLGTPLSRGQALGGQGAPTAGRRRRQRRSADLGGQTPVHPGLPADHPPATAARPALRRESAPGPLLESSLAARRAARRG